MKTFLVGFGAALAALFLCSNAESNQSFIQHDNYLVYATSLTASGVQVGNGASGTVTAGGIPYFRTEADSYLSAETFVASDTLSAGTFNDGTVSSANISISNFASISTATASGKLTISSDTGLAGLCVSGGAVGLGEFNACNPGNFAVTGTTATDCPALAAAINSFNVILATCPGAGPIIYTTAPYAGSVWNTFQMNASNPVTLSTTAFSGGQDNQSITINGKTFLASRDFGAGTSNNATATSLAAAILNSSVTTGVTANATGAVVYATSTAVGLSTNYALASSSQAALTLSVPVTLVGTSGSTGIMIGGTNASYAINTPTITISGNSFTSGLPVLYTTNTTTAINGLLWGTTYFVIGQPFLTQPSFALATSSTNAVLDMGIVLASSRTPATTDTFTLTPLPLAGTVTYQWMASDDAQNWVPFSTTINGQSISSQSISVYNSTGTLVGFDFGHMDYGYFGLSLTPPTQGAINFRAKVIGKTQ